MENTLVSEKLSNGNTINYQIINGTAYHEETCQEVINILERARNNKSRIRVFYGDSTTGRDWHEENDIIGTIGRSTGNIKIPLLIKSSSSYGGGGVLDHCIVKITIDKMVVYEHNDYDLGYLAIEESDIEGYPYSVLIDNEIHANFESLKKAENYILFLKGERNKI